MKVAVIGSRGISHIADLGAYLPKETTCIVSGGAVGVDTVAKQYAISHGLQYREILPDYKKHGSRAPLVRNHQIIEEADCVVAFWDGRSHGTAYTVHRCREKGIPVRVFLRVEAPQTDRDQIGFFDDDAQNDRQFRSVKCPNDISEDLSEDLPDGDERDW